MNIFWLDKSAKLNAQYYCDQHVTKLSLEYTQILMTARHLHGHKVSWRPAFQNHPCVRWAAATYDNYLKLHFLARCTVLQYALRYHKRHLVTDLLYRELLFPPQKDRGGGLQPPPLIMPDDYVKDHGAGPWTNAILCYRAYYLGAKLSFATWKNGQPPWVVQRSLS